MNYDCRMVNFMLSMLGGGVILEGGFLGGMNNILEMWVILSIVLMMIKINLLIWFVVV